MQVRVRLRGRSRPVSAPCVHHNAPRALVRAHCPRVLSRRRRAVIAEAVLVPRRPTPETPAPPNLTSAPAFALFVTQLLSLRNAFLFTYVSHPQIRSISISTVWFFDGLNSRSDAGALAASFAFSTRIKMRLSSLIPIFESIFRGLISYIFHIFHVFFRAH